VVPYPNFPEYGEINIQWPTLSSWRGGPAIAEDAFITVAVSVLGKYVEENQVQEEGFFMLLGLYVWQLEELGISPHRFFDLVELAEAKEWTAPATADDEAWLPLTGLWQSPSEGPQRDKLAQTLWTPYLVTTYVVETYGRDRVRTMSGALASAGSMDEWIETVTGRPAGDFERAWREWVIARWAERPD